MTRPARRADPGHPYTGRIAGLATQHDKLPLVGPAMESVIGLTVVAVEVDTDAFGTFAGEVPRLGTPFETAVAKARAGMRESGLLLGLASEGSVAPLDGLPYVLADTELVVLVDDDLGIVVAEREVALAPPAIGTDVAPGRLDPVALVRAGFPEHGLIVRPSDGWDVVVKGIHDRDELEAAIARCAADSSLGTARVESDLRAHHHPFRRTVIARAAERLAERMATRCPECAAPGWGIDRVEPGAPCSLCTTPTRHPRLEHWSCAACTYAEALPTPGGDGADPAVCAVCNP